METVELPAAPLTYERLGEETGQQIIWAHGWMNSHEALVPLARSWSGSMPIFWWISRGSAFRPCLPFPGGRPIMPITRPMAEDAPGGSADMGGAFFRLPGGYPTGRTASRPGGRAVSNLRGRAAEAVVVGEKNRTTVQGIHLQAAQTAAAL